MCCFVLVLGFLGPRLAFLWAWLFTPRVTDAFTGGFWLPLIGLIFLPWTALAYIVVWSFADGVSPLGWVVIALGFVLDIGNYSGRSAQQRFSTAQ